MCFINYLAIFHVIFYYTFQTVFLAYHDRLYKIICWCKVNDSVCRHYINVVFYWFLFIKVDVLLLSLFLNISTLFKTRIKALNQIGEDRASIDTFISWWYWFLCGMLLQNIVLKYFLNLFFQLLQSLQDVE